MSYDANKILADAWVKLPDGWKIKGFMDWSKIPGGINASICILQTDDGGEFVGYVYHRDLQREPFEKLAISEIGRTINFAKQHQEGKYGFPQGMCQTIHRSTP